MGERFSATGLDLSGLPFPPVIEPLSFERLLTAFKTEFIAQWKVKFPDSPYDVNALETDPAIITGQAWSYVELLLRGRVNDAAKALMLAFATGADLDRLANWYGVARRVITPAVSNTPAVMENDTEFRRRVQLAPEALATAGTPGAYAFHALAADSRVSDVGVVVLAPGTGEVHIVLLGRDGDGTLPAAAIENVRARLTAREVKMATDIVVVRQATIVPVPVHVRVFVPLGPDPALIQSTIVAALQAMALTRRSVGRDLPLSAIGAAAHVAGVEKVVTLAPVADVVTAPDEAFALGAVTIDVELLP